MFHTDSSMHSCGEGFPLLVTCTAGENCFARSQGSSCHSPLLWNVGSEGYCPCRLQAHVLSFSITLYREVWRRLLQEALGPFPINNPLLANRDSEGKWARRLQSHVQSLFSYTWIRTSTADCDRKLLSELFDITDHESCSLDVVHHCQYVICFYDWK